MSREDELASWSSVATITRVSTRMSALRSSRGPSTENVGTRDFISQVLRTNLRPHEIGAKISARGGRRGSTARVGLGVIHRKEELKKTRNLYCTFLKLVGPAPVFSWGGSVVRGVGLRRPFESTLAGPPAASAGSIADDSVHNSALVKPLVSHQIACAKAAARNLRR